MNTIQTTVTEKTIAAFEARRYFGKVLDGVKAGDKFVVEEYGEPVAAVIPLRIYNQWKKDREAFFDQMEEIAEAVNLSPEEADRLAAEVVQAVRTQTQPAKQV
jgi:antitoxin (DNA-binding transcriptional repressor) of toxin-antitoxin stability system